MATSTLFPPSKWLAVSAVFFGYLTSVTRAQFLATAEDFDRWNLSTDSVVAYEDPGFWDPLATKDHQRVIGCTERKGNKCGGLCLFYHGGRKTNECRMATSAHELTIVCIASTHPILFCRGDCTDCGAYTNCATRLEDGFCSIPGSFSFVQAGVENDPGLPPTTSRDSSPSPSPTPTPSPDSQTPPPPTSSSSNTPPASIPVFESTPSQSSKPTSAGSTPEFATQLGGSMNNHASTGSAGVPVSSEASELDGQPTSSAIPTGAIVGIVLGALLAGGLVVFLTLWIRKRKRSPTPPMPFDTTSNSVLTAQYHSRSLTNPWSIAPSSTSYGTSASPYGFTSMSEGDGTRPTSPLGRQIVERPPAYTRG